MCLSKEWEVLMQGGCDVKCWSCNNWQDQIYATPLELMECDLSETLVFPTSPLVFIKSWFHSCSDLEAGTRAVTQGYLMACLSFVILSPSQICQLSLCSPWFPCLSEKYLVTGLGVERRWWCFLLCSKSFPSWILWNTSMKTSMSMGTLKQQICFWATAIHTRWACLLIFTFTLLCL